MRNVYLLHGTWYWYFCVQFICVCVYKTRWRERQICTAAADARNYFWNCQFKITIASMKWSITVNYGLNSKNGLCRFLSHLNRSSFQFIQILIIYFICSRLFNWITLEKLHYYIAIKTCVKFIHGSVMLFGIYDLLSGIFPIFIHLFELVSLIFISSDSNFKWYVENVKVRTSSILF